MRDRQPGEQTVPAGARVAHLKHVPLRLRVERISFNFDVGIGFGQLCLDPFPEGVGRLSCGRHVVAACVSPTPMRSSSHARSRAGYS